MKLEGIILNEISQAQEEKYFMDSFICGIHNKTKQTKNLELIKAESRILATRGWGLGLMEKC